MIPIGTGWAVAGLVIWIAWIVTHPKKFRRVVWRGRSGIGGVVVSLLLGAALFVVFWPIFLLLLQDPEAAEDE